MSDGGETVHPSYHRFLSSMRPWLDGDMTGLHVGVDEVAHQAVAVAVEVEADQLAGPVQHRAARVAADRVGRRHEVERCLQIELVLTIEPALRQHERLAVALPLGPL